jgi:hypothetical protein
MSGHIGPSGSKKIVVAIGESMLVRASGTSATIDKLLDTTEFPDRFVPDSAHPIITNQTVLISIPGTYLISESGGTGTIHCAVGVSPVLSPDLYQGEASFVSVSSQLEVSDILAGIILVNQGSSLSTTQNLPAAADMDAAFPMSVGGFSIDFCVSNVSSDPAEECKLAINIGWTLIGSMTVQPNSTADNKSSGQFRARKTADGVWTLYRLS